MSRKYHLKCQCCLRWYLFCWWAHALGMAPLQPGSAATGDQLRAWSLVRTLYWQGAVTTLHQGSFLPHIPPHWCRRSCFYSLHLHTHEGEERCMLQVRVRSPLLTAALLSCTWNGTTEISTFPPSITLTVHSSAVQGDPVNCRKVS